MMGKKIYGLSVEKRNEKRKKVYKQSEEIFVNLCNEKGSRIPHITHRMWITRPENPYEVPKNKLELYIKSLKKLSSTSEWRHMFWCMDKTKIPETIKFLKNSEIPIEVHHIDEISPKMKGGHLFDYFYENKLLVLATDVARQNVVYLFGGVYSDIGVLFNKDLTPYVDAYDYIFQVMGDDPTSWKSIDHAFFGYKKRDPIFKVYLDNINFLYSFPEEIRKITSRKMQYKDAFWVWHPHFFAVFENFYKENDRILFVPEGKNSLILINNSNSWIKGTFGNKKVHEVNFDIFSIIPQ